MKSSKPLKPVDNIGDPFKRKDVRNEALPIQNPSSNLRSTTRHELPYISAVEKQKESTNKGPLAKSSEWDDTLRGVLAREMVKHRVSSPSSSNAQMKNQSIERDSVKVSSAYDPVERKRSSSSGKSVRVRDQNVKRSQQVIRNEARMTEVSKKKFYLPLLRRLQRKTPSKRCEPSPCKRKTYEDICQYFILDCINCYFLDSILLDQSYRSYSETNGIIWHINYYM